MPRHSGLRQEWKGKGGSLLGYLLTAEEDKSPQRFDSTDLQLDMQQERLLHLYRPSEEDLLRSLWMKARF